ncbi:hypothetical protein, partial [Klebsiella pneumoniae]
RAQKLLRKPQPIHDEAELPEVRGCEHGRCVVTSFALIERNRHGEPIGWIPLQYRPGDHAPTRTFSSAEAPPQAPTHS